MTPRQRGVVRAFTGQGTPTPSVVCGVGHAVLVGQWGGVVRLDGA
ncbi:hypothetical protein [Paractinoplanes brasiliensis]|nr:hypothetical protein [Actinoplanes brasiliensis]